jgi:hypothetical protein
VARVIQSIPTWLLGNGAVEAQGSRGPTLPPYPEPEGYEGVSSYWVAAQDLKAGDKVRQASGGTGTAIALLTTQESQAMFNLDVAELDNYYVGEYGWLVHNQVPDINYHHIFPQEFKNFFGPLGININDYTVGVYNGWEHQRGIHGRGGVIVPRILSFQVAGMTDGQIG